MRLRECPDVVINPWSPLVQESNLPPHALPPETHITDVYDEADGNLLILGEPSTGKTTLLLELAHDLLERAGLDETHPIPNHKRNLPVGSLLVSSVISLLGRSRPIRSSASA